MTQDDIITEIRRYRDEHAKRFNYDVRAMAADIKSREKLGTSPLVSFDQGQGEFTESGELDQA